MGKVIDLEEERQKAKARAKEYPPFICLRGKGGIRIIPKWEKGPDWEWRTVNEEAIKSMLGYGRDETDKEGEPKED
jgi:hypothetical protein